ncbi:MAG TPA: hypothetical protein V6D19_02740 [Stenomitos sp.]
MKPCVATDKKQNSVYLAEQLEAKVKAAAKAAGKGFSSLIENLLVRIYLNHAVVVDLSEEDKALLTQLANDEMRSVDNMAQVLLSEAIRKKAKR